MNRRIRKITVIKHDQHPDPRAIQEIRRAAGQLRVHARDYPQQVAEAVRDFVIDKTRILT